LYSEEGIVVNKYLDRLILFGAFLSLTVIFSSHLNAQTLGKRYFCAVLNGTYKTFVATSRGNIPIVTWARNSGDWTPRQRCIIGSQRFQSFSDQGMLKNIGTGRVNYEPVLCAVVRKGDACNSNNVLVTLPRDANTTEVARQLLDIRTLASGRGIQVNGGEKLESYVNGQYYFDVNSIEQIATPETQTLTPLDP
jgi:hypothetical protein